MLMGCSGCDWDPAKNRQNWRKHRIRFEDACCVFEDPCEKMTRMMRATMKIGGSPLVA